MKINAHLENCVTVICNIFTLNDKKISKLKTK